MGGSLYPATLRKKLTNTTSLQEKSTKHRHCNMYVQCDDLFIYTLNNTSKILHKINTSQHFFCPCVDTADAYKSVFLFL